jgi:hypothetical protein
MSEINNRIRNSKDYQNIKKTFEREILPNVGWATEWPKPGISPSPSKKSKKNISGLYLKWKKSERISRILKELKTEVEQPSEIHKSMSKLLVYLGLVESLGVTLVDMALMLLIESGKAVHTRGPFPKHITSFEELQKERMNLENKLELLKEEKLNLFKKSVNPALRNMIAHLNFTIDNEGKIKDKGNNEIVIDEEIAKFWKGVDTIKLALEDLGLLARLEKFSSTKRESESHEA